MTGNRRTSAKRAVAKRSPRRTSGKTIVRDPAYEPARTPLGGELRRLRAKIIESGEKLLDWDDIEKMTAEWRGGRRGSRRTHYDRKAH